MNIDVANDPERVGRRAWRAAFNDQLTRATLRKVQKYATKRAKLLVRAGVLAKECGPRELMHDAIVKTLAGEASWDPDAVKLESHLIGVIKWSTRNAERRRAKYQERSLDDSGEDTSSDGHRLENAITRGQAQDGVDHVAACRDAARRVISEIRPLARRDADVLRLLDAMEAGAGEGDLIHASGLDAEQYRNARRRLARIAERMSNETRAAVEAVLN